MIACLAPFCSNFLTFLWKFAHFVACRNFCISQLRTNKCWKKASNLKSLAKIDVFLSPNFNHTIKNDKTVRSQKKWKMWLYQSYSELFARFVLAWKKLFSFLDHNLFFLFEFCLFPTLFIPLKKSFFFCLK